MSRPNYNADRELIRLQIVVREEYWITSDLALFMELVQSTETTDGWLG